MSEEISGFEIGQTVSVDAADYTGVIVDARDEDYLVRYVVPNARKPFYETWWPATYLKVLSA